MMATPDEDLNQLERDIRQLKIEYEQYFGGGRARPPSEIEWRIEQVIKRYGDRTAEINFGQRFRYNNLAQTYAKYKEIFRKRFKQREEGIVQRHFGATAKAIEAERARKQTAQEHAPAEPARECTVACAEPEREPEKVRELYQALMDAQENTGENAERITLESFQEFLRQKTQQLKDKEGCQNVEYVVVLDGGRARLKARVRA